MTCSVSWTQSRSSALSPKHFQWTEVSWRWNWEAALHLSSQDNTVFLFSFFFYAAGHICCGIMTGVSQMEHEECVCVFVRACRWECMFGRGELMSLRWAIIRTLALRCAITKGNISELPNGGVQHDTNPSHQGERCPVQTSPWITNAHWRRGYEQSCFRANGHWCLRLELG